ncbi:hypothetical protein J3458_007150 [Metarhizium acridum]|uniref:uncharacterized protein n=1 Tax=Metarhizium acridum TaxID=92637 RepID=UPI001C6CB408|nr:hypothetical protein J3458_007150 [Metarhizium acridum]
MSKRPSVCHYAFHRAEKATRSILHLAQDLDAWKSYRRAELVVRRELKKFVKDMATAGSLWDEDDLNITFPSVVARLVGCSSRTFGQANVFQRIAAKSREILDNTLKIRNYHIAASENDPMRDVWLASLARQAESLQVKLNNIETELRGAMGAYLPAQEKKSGDGNIC